MRQSRIFFTALFISLFMVSVFTSFVNAHGLDPQDALIKQVLSDTIEDLGFSVDDEVDTWVNQDAWDYDVWSLRQGSSYVYIQVIHCFTEQRAIEIKEDWCEWLSETKTSLHGYPACYDLNYSTNVDLSTEAVYYWRAGTLFFAITLSPPRILMSAAETLYANAVKSGLVNVIDPLNDTDGDGVADDLDRCPNTPAGITVDADGCPVEINLILTTNKSTYAPGENVVISGSVAIDGNTVAGADITLNINGQTTNVISGRDGGYSLNFTIPADTTTFSYQVSATVNHPAYQPVTRQTTFTVGRDMNITITHDKDYYLIGDPVHCTITLKDDAGDPVPYADLTVTTTHLASGRIETFNGRSDALGENLWDFIWGKDAAGKTISEGKLKIEVNGSKDGYNAGSADITLSGCGDQVHNDGEDCFICPEDCACGPNEVCDPASDYKDTATMCSPKVACIFISNGLSWYEKWWASDDIKGIRKKYRKLGYKLTPNIYVNDINDVAKYLSRPSTKAIAYAGHGPDAGKPGIETVGSDAIPSMIIMSNRSAGSFLYRCRYEIYADKWVDLQNRIEAAATTKANYPELDYVFMFSCYSLDNFSLRDYLLKSGGTYWGYRGKLPGNGTLLKSVKP